VTPSKPPASPVDEVLASPLLLHPPAKPVAFMFVLLSEHQ
jgi:hypothetical protein